MASLKRSEPTGRTHQAKGNEKGPGLAGPGNTNGLVEEPLKQKARFSRVLSVDLILVEAVGRFSDSSPPRT